jgi:hypothetical protein
VLLQIRWLCFPVLPLLLHTHTHTHYTLFPITWHYWFRQTVVIVRFRLAFYVGYCTCLANTAVRYTCSSCRGRYRIRRKSSGTRPCWTWHGDKKDMLLQLDTLTTASVGTAQWMTAHSSINQLESEVKGLLSDVNTLAAPSPLTRPVPVCPSCTPLSQSRPVSWSRRFFYRILY